MSTYAQERALWNDIRHNAVRKCPETERALWQAVTRWLYISLGKEGDRSDANQPLCDLYLARRGSCTWCPVELNSHFPHCRGTPYQAWIAHHWKKRLGGPTYWAETAEEKALATRQYQYLLDLVLRSMD